MQAQGSTGTDTLGAVLVNRVPIEVPAGGATAALVLAVLLTFVGGMVLISGGIVPGAVFLLLGVLLGAFGVSRFVRRARLRGTFTVYQRGLVVSRQGTDTVFPFSQLEAFTLLEQETFSDGLPTGMSRTLGFQWPGGGGRFSQFSPTQSGAPLGRAITQLLEGLANAAEAKLEAGGGLRGDGWTLSSQGLKVAKREPVRLDELTRVGMYSGLLSLWLAREERPFLSVPQGGTNARVLAVLAQRHASQVEQPLPEGSLGRFLFQRGGFSVYEGGVTDKSLLGDHTLLYSQVRSFKFELVREHVNGGYGETSLSMRFTSGPGGPVVYYGQKVPGRDADLEALRDHVSEVLSGHLLKRVERGEEVHWGPSARFTQDGLRIRPSTMFGEDVEQTVPYDADLSLSIKEGICHLFLGNDREALMSIESTATNFYPGLKMIKKLASPSR